MEIVNFTDHNEMRAAIEALKRQLPELKEYTKMVAEYRWAQYNEYVLQGFTKEQAIDLCKVSLL